MSLAFDATNDYAAFTPAAFASWTGYTLACLYNMGALNNYRTFYYAGAGASANGNLSMGMNNSNRIYNELNGTGRNGPTVAATGWHLTVIAKATGTATANWYHYRYSTAGNSNGTMSGTSANPPTTAQTVEEMGRWGGGNNDLMNGCIAIFAIYPTQLTQQEAQSLQFNFRNWIRPNTQSLWVPGYNDVTSIRDLAGRANSSSVNGSPVQHTEGIPGFGNVELLRCRPTIGVHAAAFMARL